MTVLHDELVAIEGVTDAEVEIVDDGPPAVRLRVGPGADRRRVGELVQEILANHGLKSRVAPERTSPEPLAAPSPPIGGLPGDAPGAAAGRDTTAQQPAALLRRLVALGVVEERTRVVVNVRDDQGRSAQAVGTTGRRALRDAVVVAVHDLVGRSGAAPSVVAILHAKEGERNIITVVLDVGGTEMVVGSAFVGVGWEFAFGRAVWAALTD
jgi:hypothetical protein